MWSYITLSHTMKLVGEHVQKGLVFWVLGKDSWIMRFGGCLNYIPSYRHTRCTTNFCQIIDKNVNWVHVGALLCYQWYWE